MRGLNLPLLVALCAVSLSACGLEDDATDAAPKDDYTELAELGDVDEIVIDEVIDLDAPSKLKIAAPWDGAKAHAEATGCRMFLCGQRLG